MIWTTTPWTLPANLGIAVHPEFDYSAIEVGNEVYIVASELARPFSLTCGFEDYVELARFKGTKLDRHGGKTPVDRSHVTIDERRTCHAR